MRISLIGMSNIGKSYLARHLAATKGFTHINCDRMIEEKLGVELAKEGYVGTAGMARWMGFPYEPHYKKHSGLYTNAESAIMRDVFAHLNHDKNISAVIDTTGSVIYCSEDILENLRAATTVIYLEASEEHINALFKNFIAHPKPVIWGESFKPRVGESNDQALQRYYPELLLYRMQHYRNLAHSTIPYEQHQNRKKEIWSVIAEQIKEL